MFLIILIKSLIIGGLVGVGVGAGKDRRQMDEEFEEF